MGQEMIDKKKEEIKNRRRSRSRASESEDRSQDTEYSKPQIKRRFTEGSPAETAKPGNGREEASLIAPSSDSSINVAKVETQEIFPDSTEDVTIGIKETTSQDDSKAAIDVKVKAEEEPKETNVQPEESLD